MNPLKKIQALFDRVVTWWHRRQYRKQMQSQKIGSVVAAPTKPLEVQRFGKGTKLPKQKVSVGESGFAGTTMLVSRDKDSCIRRVYDAHGKMVKEIIIPIDELKRSSFGTASRDTINPHCAIRLDNEPWLRRPGRA